MGSKKEYHLSSSSMSGVEPKGASEASLAVPSGFPECDDVTSQVLTAYVLGGKFFMMVMKKY